MIFGTKMLRNPTIRIGQVNIKRVETYKYLGLMVDEKLTFYKQLKRQKHISCAEQITDSLGRLNRFKGDSLRTIFRVAVVPIATLNITSD